MLQGIVPQAVIVRGHCVTLCTASVMAVFNQADSDTGGFRAHFRIIAVHAVEQMPFIVTVSIGNHKRATIAERVKGPDTTVVLITEAVHPGKNTGFQRYPLWDRAKVLRPEIETLFVGNLRYCEFEIGFVSGYGVVLCRCCHVNVSVNKKRQRRWLAYGVIMDGSGADSQKWVLSVGE